MQLAADFNDQVRRHISRLKTQSLADLERDVAVKRRSWLVREWPRLGSAYKRRPVRPRLAFELLFFEYMRIEPQDLPILMDTLAEIAWSSENPCPTLAACAELGVDTRLVCRRVYEKSTQIFLSQLDPELRFFRDYSAIRPHASGCRERIIRVDFAAMMRTAIAEARRSRQEGNKGYGALVVLGDRILAQAHDTATTDRDPSLHAEVNAILAAIRATGDPDLCGTILVSTCEPCPMCAALALWANVTTIVFGASIAETAARGKARINIPASEIIERGPAMVEVVPGILAPECLSLYE